MYLFQCVGYSRGIPCILPKAMSEHPLSGCMGRTLEYYNWKDKLDCQLWVPYLHYGLMSYKCNRNEGGIGMECCFISQPGGPGVPQLSKRQPLKYAERFKTLKSFILEKACYRSLSLLAMPRKSGDEAIKFESEIKIDEERSDHILELQKPQIHVQWWARPAASCVEQELLYSDELSPTLSANE